MPWPQGKLYCQEKGVIRYAANEEAPARSGEQIECALASHHQAWPRSLPLPIENVNGIGTQIRD
jgi:hypothetical protein